MLYPVFGGAAETDVATFEARVVWSARPRGDFTFVALFEFVAEPETARMCGGTAEAEATDCRFVFVGWILATFEGPGVGAAIGVAVLEVDTTEEPALFLFSSNSGRR